MADANWILFTLATLGIGIGILGTLLPFIPGTSLIFATIAITKWLRPENIETWLVIVAATAFFISWLMEWIAGGIGAKILGGTRWGILGAILGSLIGFLFFPLGLVLGPIIGAVIAELWIGKNSMQKSAKIGLGAGFSIILLIVFKLTVSIALGIIFVWDYWWN
jgi:uncharacterized protein YqgC (DUF456 family)